MATFSDLISNNLYQSGRDSKVHFAHCGHRSLRAGAIRGTKELTWEEVYAQYGSRLCRYCFAEFEATAEETTPEAIEEIPAPEAIEETIEEATPEAPAPEAIEEIPADKKGNAMKGLKVSTLRTIEYLCAPEGKEAYKKALNHHRSGGSRNEPIWDRFPGYALEEIHNSLGGGCLDQDEVLDGFIKSTSMISPDGDTLYTSTLPRLIATTKDKSRMAASLGKILNNDESRMWGN